MGSSVAPGGGTACVAAADMVGVLVDTVSLMFETVPRTRAPHLEISSPAGYHTDDFGRREQRMPPHQMLLKKLAAAG